MNCSPPASSVHGIFQARILEWVAISFSRESSCTRDWTLISCVGRLPRYSFLFICPAWGSQGFRKLWLAFSQFWKFLKYFLFKWLLLPYSLSSLSRTSVFTLSSLSFILSTVFSIIVSMFHTEYFLPTDFPVHQFSLWLCLICFKAIHRALHFCYCIFNSKFLLGYFSNQDCTPPRHL